MTDSVSGGVGPEREARDRLANEAALNEGDPMAEDICTVLAELEAAEKREADLARLWEDARERMLAAEKALREIHDTLHGDLCHSITHLMNEAALAIQEGTAAEAAARFSEVRESVNALLGELAGSAARTESERCGCFALTGTLAHDPACPNAARTESELYREMVDLVERNGWRREEPGSGWWHHGAEEETIGGAVEIVFHNLGIDMREEPKR